MSFARSGTLVAEITTSISLDGFLIALVGLERLSPLGCGPVEYYSPEGD